LQRIASLIGYDPWALKADVLTDWLGQQRWAIETRRGYRNTLRAFYKWGVSTGRTADDVGALIPVVRASRPNPRPLPDLIYMTALAAADDRAKLMLRLGAEMGLRRSEVAQVHSDDFLPDLDGYSLRVHGKGGKERMIPLPVPLAHAMMDLPYGYAFPGDDHGHLSPRWVGTIVSRLLPDGWTMHKLRHRFATRAYAIDRDVFTVQELLGHASPATTRAYVAVPREGLRRTVLAAA
jgi:integrase